MKKTGIYRHELSLTIGGGRRAAGGGAANGFVS
jgi:hypothetical protein